MIKHFLLTVAVMAVGMAASALTWTADKAHSRLGFSITHLMVSEVDGSFRNFTATIRAEKPDFSDAVFELHAEAASINTENAKRDAHLRTPDYFDAEKYPAITFRSTGFRKGNGSTYTLTGNLTMHGVTKPVTMNAVLIGHTVHPTTRKHVAGFRISGKISRLDFGIGKATGKAALGDEVSIVASGEFIQE